MLETKLWFTMNVVTPFTLPRAALAVAGIHRGLSLVCSTHPIYSFIASMMLKTRLLFWSSDLMQAPVYGQGIIALVQ